MTPNVFTHPFDRLVRSDEQDIPLLDAWILLGRDVAPDVDPEALVTRIADLADRVRVHLPEHGGDALDTVAALRRVLVDEEGFRGNAGDYYDPANSYLHSVLDRRRGIPISLSVLWIIVAARAGRRLHGIGLPGHFLLALDAQDSPEEMFLDPFHGGRILTRLQAGALVSSIFGVPVQVPDESFQPSPSRAILSRMLNNLKAIHARSGNWPGVERTLARLVALEPTSTSLIGEYGLARHESVRLN